MKGNELRLWIAFLTTWNFIIASIMAYYTVTMAIIPTPPLKNGKKKQGSIGLVHVLPCAFLHFVYISA